MKGDIRQDDDSDKNDMKMAMKERRMFVGYRIN